MDLQERNYVENYVSNNKKSGLITWLLWLFLGAFGAHRFYHGKTGSGLTLLLLNIFNIVFGIFLLYIPFIVIGIWLIVDAFNINKWVRESKQQAYREAMEHIKY